MAGHEHETARRFYAGVKASEEHMEAAGDRMHNRDLWLGAQDHLRKSRESLPAFLVRLAGDDPAFPLSASSRNQDGVG